MMQRALHLLPDKCPSCGEKNAMLFSTSWDERAQCAWVDCRTCNHTGHIDPPVPASKSLAWGDVPRRDRVLIRVMLDLEDLLDATGNPRDREWFTWAEQTRLHVRAYLVGRGFPV